MVPVNVPPYETVFVKVQSVNVPVAVPPEELDPNPAPLTVHRKNVPDAEPPACPPKLVAPAVQSVNTPEAVLPNESELAEHLVNVPDADPLLPPKEPLVAVQSSNNPEALAPEPVITPEKDPAPPTHRRYVPEYSVINLIPELLSPLNTQFSIYVRLNRSVAVPILPAALTAEGYENELSSILVTVNTPSTLELPDPLIRTESPVWSPCPFAAIVIVVPSPDHVVIAVALGKGKYAAVLPAPDPAGAPVRSIVTPLIFTSFAV
jgi:hypothetical protein